jgi:putative colanic acid biosynthesis glycosyltransferase
MKVVQINTFSYKATGTIMMNLHKLMQEKEIDSYVIWGRGRETENDHEISIEDGFGIKFHGVYTRITDKTGFASKRATRELVEKLQQIKPDIIHLHNIHGYYLNIEMLFQYIKFEKIKVVWTLHDCWPFTGHCTHFDYVGCEKWKTGCYNCSQKNAYPSSKLFDNSKWNYKKKKELFSDIEMTIVPVSGWLSNKVNESFLSSNSVKVIYNGIDLDIFRPRKSQFKEEHGLMDKIVLLGVASDWGEKKGLYDFIELSKMLPNNYQIVLVGLSNSQLRMLPINIIGLNRAKDVEDLVKIYNAADIFLNLSVEETMGMTSLEAMACGKPVIVYDATALPEIIPNKCGVKIQKRNLQELKEILVNWKTYDFNEEDCIQNAVNFDKNIKFNQYIDLYRRLNTDESTLYG